MSFNYICRKYACKRNFFFTDNGLITRAGWYVKSVTNKTNGLVDTTLFSLTPIRRFVKNNSLKKVSELQKYLHRAQSFMEILRRITKATKKHTNIVKQLNRNDSWRTNITAKVKEKSIPLSKESTVKLPPFCSSVPKKMLSHIFSVWLWHWSSLCREVWG